MMGISQIPSYRHSRFTREPLPRLHFLRQMQMPYTLHLTIRQYGNLIGKGHLHPNLCSEKPIRGFTYFDIGDSSCRTKYAVLLNSGWLCWPIRHKSTRQPGIMDALRSKNWRVLHAPTPSIPLSNCISR